MKTFKLSIFLICLFFTGFLFISGSKANTNSKNKVHYEPTWESLMQKNATPQGYQDAVLGFYFHWGPYSVLGFGCAGYWTMYMPESSTYKLVKEKYGEPGIGSLRFTRKKEYLYAIDLEKPTVPLVSPDISPLEGSEIKMLGSDKSLKWHQDEDNLVIDEIPDPLPCDYAWSFKIQIEDKSW